MYYCNIVIGHCFLNYRVLMTRKERDRLFCGYEFSAISYNMDINNTVEY